VVRFISHPPAILAARGGRSSPGLRPAVRNDPLSLRIGAKGAARGTGIRGPFRQLRHPPPGGGRLRRRRAPQSTHFSVSGSRLLGTQPWRPDSMQEK
jgi:hypothetical protein